MKFYRILWKRTWNWKKFSFQYARQMFFCWTFWIQISNEFKCEILSKKFYWFQINFVKIFQINFVKILNFFFKLTKNFGNLIYLIIYVTILNFNWKIGFWICVKKFFAAEQKNELKISVPKIFESCFFSFFPNFFLTSDQKFTRTRLFTIWIV